MSVISEFMTDDHRHCDELFADIETAMVKSDQAGAKVRLEQFLAAMEHHFQMEEEILFPAFEAATGMSMGPTAMMRHEHAQMRQMFRQMHDAMAAGDADNYLGIAETLLVMMQQHNIKEEQILYPMTDNALASQEKALIEQLKMLDAA